MTPGIFLDKLLIEIYSLIMDYPLIGVGVGIAGLCLAAIRAITDHYNFSRARLNIVAALSFLIIWSTINLTIKMPELTNDTAWRMYASTTLMILTLVLAYYLTALLGRYFGDPITMLKRDLSNFLQSMKLQIESSIEAKSEKEAIELKAAQTITEVVKEKMGEAKLEDIKVMIGMI